MTGILNLDTAGRIVGTSNSQLCQPGRKQCVVLPRFISILNKPRHSEPVLSEPAVFLMVSYRSFAGSKHQQDTGSSYP